MKRSLEHDRIFGYDRLVPGWTWDTFLEHVVPEHRLEVARHFEQTVRAVGDWQLDCRIMRRDGVTRWIRVAAARHEGPQRIAGVVQDVTDLRQVLAGPQDSHDSRDKYQALRETTGGAPYFDEDGNLLGFRAISRDVTERRDAETALRRSEQLLRAVTDNSPDAIYVKDLRSRWLLANPAVLHIVGKTAEEALGRTDLELYSDAAVGRAIVANDQRIIARGEAEAIEEVADTPDGRRIFLSIKAPRRDADGNVIGIVGISRDITDRKLTEARLARQSAVLAGIARIFREALTCETEAALGAVCLAVAEQVTQSKLGFIAELDPESGKLNDIAISDPGRRLCGMCEPSGHGQNLPRGFPVAGLYGRVVRDGRSLCSNAPRAHPDSHGAPDGHPALDAFLGVPLVQGGATIGVMGLGNREGGYGPEEIDAAERLAPAIVQSLVSKRAQQALRDSDRRKDEFLAVLSHELRGPLAPIRNSVFLLQHAPPGGAQADRAKDIIDRQSAHLARLVDDLLDLNRISRGKIQLERRACDLAELVRRTVEDHRATFVERGVALAVETPEPPVPLHADPTRIGQAIGNLLGNAGKFTPRGGSVRVSVSLADGQAVVRVADTGVGVAAELLGRIFDPFEQAKQTLARSQGGLGLGLALVKGFVEMHGGSVSVHSDGPGCGAEFVVRLPSGGPPPPAGTSPPQPK